MQHIPKPLLFVTAGLGLVAIVLIALMAGSYYKPEEPTIITTNTTVPANTNTTRTNTNTTNANTNTADLNTNVNANTNTDTGRMAAGASGITWLAEPELLEDLGLLQNGGDIDTYYKVGELSDGGSIIYMYRQEMGYNINRFRENSDGTYVFLANYSNNYGDLEPTDYLTTGVTWDGETVYSELDYPDTFLVNDLALSVYYRFGSGYTLDTELSADQQAQLEEFATTDYGRVYEFSTPIATTYEDGSIVGKQYLLVLPDHSIVPYTDQLDFLSDDNTVSAAWAKTYSDFAERSYMNGLVVTGCGATGGNQYAVDFTPEAAAVVGTTDSGDTLYTVLDDSNPLLQNAYESYKLGRDYEGSTVVLLSYEEFVAATPLLIWEDAVGDYLLFLDANYAPNVECGKPVVYLYPTETTDVTVQVGAAVRISEPNYGDGWAVRATPESVLQTADGKIYPSLYWEGKGYGAYPEINFGRVVARPQVSTALKSDLIKQGLNAHEINDFLEFWMPRMPNTPYVRLSWLNTAQMNTLAPLHIQPKPDTMIRVFLDFAGQTTKDTVLQPQTLTAVSRTGFTVTEWGGLLLGQ